MKIGIITLFNLNTVNYGNHLQAYALNRYIRENYPGTCVETILNSKKTTKFQRTEIIGPSAVWKIIRRIIKECFRPKHQTAIQAVSRRLSRFRQFASESVPMAPVDMDWDKLCTSDYDRCIVGSDIVWAQDRYAIDRTRFLDFENSKRAKKYSYAASFGSDWIPEKNIDFIKRYLASFQGISVRKKTSVEMLDRIGVHGAVHTVDSTLLLDREHWEAFGRAPLDFPLKRYAFVYLLGKELEQRDAIQEFCKKKGLQIVFIPFADKTYSKADMTFGDIQIMDASPREWVWLVRHAEYVITDSFHGAVFSTIFEKKFFVVARQYEIQEWNNRLIDFLDTIGQSDKYIDFTSARFDDFTWDYQEINSKLKEKIDFSKKFLDAVMREEKDAADMDPEQEENHDSEAV